MARCGALDTVWGINGGASVGGFPLDRYGSAQVNQKYLAPLLRGQQRHCLCVTEPASMHPADIAKFYMTLTKTVGSDVAGTVGASRVGSVDAR
jgi:alkylation response protein AidB-like acyl-CoA dehydrogenase